MRKTLSSALNKKPLQFLFILFFLDLSIFSIILVGLPFNSFYFSLLISIIILSETGKWGAFIYLLKNEIIILLIISVYTTSRYLFFNAHPVTYRMPLVILGFLIIAYAINIYCKIYKFDIFFIFKTLILVNVIISLLFFLFPTIMDLFSAIVDFKYKGSEMNANYREDVQRGFALISRGTFFDYPITIGIYIALIINDIINKQSNLFKNILAIILAFFAIGINARVGFIPILMYLTFITFNNITLKKTIYILLTVSVIAIVSFHLYENNEQFAWAIKPIIWGFNFITNNGEEIGHLRPLFGQFIFFSDNPHEIIWGTGKNVFYGAYISGNGFVNSDVGYIQQISYGGIVYLLLIVSFFILMFIKLIKSTDHDSFNKFIPFTFIFTILLCNIKGNFFQLQSALNTIIIIYIFVIYQKSIKNTYAERSN